MGWVTAEKRNVAVGKNSNNDDDDESGNFLCVYKRVYGQNNGYP